MSKIWLTGFALLSALFFTNTSGINASQSKQNASEALTGTLQKMIVENASVTMQLDLNGLNGSSSLVARPVPLHFTAAPNSFFSILVFNDLLRGLQPGSMALALPNSSSAGVNGPDYSNLPAALSSSLKRLTLEKLPSGQGFDLAVRDSNTGFTFFNIEGHQYNYDAAAQSFTITGGRLLISKQFASTLGILSEAGSLAGTISVGAAMQPIQIDHVVRGETKSMVMPPVQHAAGPRVPNLVPGPDVIVGDVENVEQFNSPVGTQVGLAIGTDSCNNGDQPVNWFALPNTDHPVVPQNLYRMSGGANNDTRFEQIGHSWMKHTFLALQDSVCGFCNTNPPCNPGPQLCPGCSDPYTSGLNGDQNSIGSRAWVNPFTGSFPSTANNHSGHSHDSVSHRIRTEVDDLNPTLNSGATYFGEATYVSPHEYTWCQSHPAECNMFNNVSYRRFSVSGGPTFFNFSAVGSTVRMQPAIMAWAATGATVTQYQPVTGNDGIFFVGYKVTGPDNGVWHYEYAVYNENLDRAIQSFSVPVATSFAMISNIGFHAPPQEPGWANDGTFNNQGYSSTTWAVTQDPGCQLWNGDCLMWNSETFAQNQNANAIRFGTLYNFRFDADHSPSLWYATIGFFKTGSPITVVVPCPIPQITPTASPTATPTATATSTPTATATATATFTPTPTATATATATATPTATATSSATPTSTPRPTPTPRSNASPRPRPTPLPRP